MSVPGTRKTSAATTIKFQQAQPKVVVMATSLTSTALLAIFGLLISETREIVQTQFLDSSPLKECPVSILIFLISLLLYCCASGYHIKCQIYTPTATSFLNRSFKVAFISGSLAYIALISMLVSRSLQPLFYIAWFMVLFIYFNSNKIAEIISENIGLYLYEQWRRTVRGNGPGIRRPPV